MSKPVSYDVAGYEEFRFRAQDTTLSGNQRAGFPEAYRAGRSEAILADIDSKLPAFSQSGARLLDIGIGCSDLSHAIVARAAERGQQLTLIDSPEILSQLQDGPSIRKIEGPFPTCTTNAGAFGPFDAILAYSVVQYVFAESNLNQFIDSAAMLLNEREAALLIGDIPNASMRKRFLDSDGGRAYHAAHYPGEPAPSFRFNSPEPGQIDDAVVLGVVARARACGFQAFVLPQPITLPMANRREDILIRRP
jgi:hypothetical protein